MKIQILFFLQFFSSLVFSQNLLPNPGFEKMNNCLEHQVFCSVEAWRHTTQVLVRCEDDPEMEQRAARGRGMMSILMGRPFSGKNEREYLQVPILCPLIKGEQYKLSFALKYEYAIVPEIGVAFSKTVVHQNRAIPLHIPVTARFHKVVFDENRNLGNGWVKIEYQFTATGDERYMLVGNFYPTHKMEYELVVPKRKVRRDRAVYLVDNFSLRPVNSKNACDFSDYLSAIRANTNRHPYVDLPYPFEHKEIDIVPPVLAIQTDTLIFPKLQFEFDSYDLLSDAFPVLDSLSETLMQLTNWQLSVNGHTDYEGGELYNKELSYNRARTVSDYLISKGLSSENISFQGYGMSYPVSTNTTTEGRALNRRVEFIVQTFLDKSR